MHLSENFAYFKYLRQPPQSKFVNDITSLRTILLPGQNANRKKPLLVVGKSTPLDRFSAQLVSGLTK